MSEAEENLSEDEGQVLVSSSKSHPSSKELSFQRRFLRVNRQGYGLVLLVSVSMVLISNIINTVMISAKGAQPIEANYAFRETIRSTRRAKTLSTYARKRGPMILADVEGYMPLNGMGVTHLEDAFGGLISGPRGLWRNGEIYAYEFKKGTAPSMTLENLRESLAHWTNGNPDPCVDRQIYIGGQNVPQQNNASTSIQVMFGYLNLNCAASEHNGYFSIFESLTHGGVLVGRIYRIKTTCDYAGNATMDAQAPSIGLTEIGAVLEDRGFGSSAHFQTLLGLMFVPIIIWYFIFIRLTGVQLTINLSITGTGGVKNQPARLGSARLGSARLGSARLGSARSARTAQSDTTNDSDKDVSASDARKERVLSKNINQRIVDLWKLPLYHWLYLFLYLLLEQITYSDQGILNRFIFEVDMLHINYRLHVIALVSQELSPWLLGFYSSWIRDKNGLKVNQKAMIYAYQYSHGYLFLMRALNVILSFVLVLDGCYLVSDDQALYIISFVAFALVGTECAMILSAFQSNPFDDSPACSVGALTSGYSFMTRQMSQYLVSQQVKGLKAFDRKHHAVPGMEYIGTISDAIALTRPDYIIEGLINGELIQVQVLEIPSKSTNSLAKIKEVGNHQFQLKRHFLQQGNQAIALI